MKEHSAMLSARQAISQSRRSRGILSTLTQFAGKGSNRVSWDYKNKASSACRIHGNIEVKKVTGECIISTRL
jgi:endoplasmic reticulum-Golgi intermediate compartment protein 2